MVATGSPENENLINLDVASSLFNLIRSECSNLAFQLHFQPLGARTKTVYPLYKVKMIYPLNGVARHEAEGVTFLVSAHLFKGIGLVRSGVKAWSP